LNMKSYNSETITSQLGQLTLTGTSDSERGADSQQSGAESVVIKDLPKLFQNKEVANLEWLTREMEKLIQKRKVHEIAYKKDISKLLLEMKKMLTTKSDGHIALCLQTIAETFQVKIPTDLGLHMYFEVLNKYPQEVMTLVTKDVVATYKYARLPIPSEFVSKCEPIYLAHTKYYRNKLHTICTYEHYLANGFPDNKYLEGKI